MLSRSATVVHARVPILSMDWTEYRMSFSGDLRGIGLSDIFQNVSANRATGTLRIRGRRFERYVRFESGVVAGFSLGVGKGLPMLDHLRGRGYVDPQAMDRALTKGKRSRKAPTLLLVEAGVIDDDTLRGALLECIEEGLYDLFVLREAEFSFEEGDAPGRVFDSEQRRLGVKLDVGPILMEAARRRDENERVQKVVATEQDVFVLLEGWEERVEDDMSVEIAPLLDGHRDVATIVREIGGSPFHVKKAIFDLVQAGAARPSTAEELAAIAEEELSEGQQDEALRLMARALELARSDIELRARYAELLESAGRTQEAAVEHARLGHDAERGGDLVTARDAYDRAVGLSPDDLALREKRAAIFEQSGEDDELAAVVLELVDRHLAMGLADRARALLSGVVERRRLQSREDLVTALARVESSLGHWQEAAKLYRRLGEGVIRTDEAHGIELLRAALDQDPEDAELQQLVEEIETGRAKRRRSLRRKLAIVGSGLAVVGSFVFVGWSEFSASRRAAAALGEGLGFLEEGEGVRALEELVAVADNYGWTPTGRAVPAWIQRLADLQLEAVRTHIAAARYDEAERICTTMKERLPRPDLVVTCDALLARIAREREAFSVLERVERMQRRPTAPELESLEALGEGEHLDFLIARIEDVRDHETRAAMLRALARIDSPRSYPAVARLMLRARDDVTRNAGREVLRGAASQREEGHEAEWQEVYPELERALTDPERAPVAREVLQLLRGQGRG